MPRDSPDGRSLHGLVDNDRLVRNHQGRRRFDREAPRNEPRCGRRRLGETDSAQRPAAHQAPVHVHRGCRRAVTLLLEVRLPRVRRRRAAECLREKVGLPTLPLPHPKIASLVAVMLEPDVPLAHDVADDEEPTETTTSMGLLVAAPVYRRRPLRRSRWCSPMTGSTVTDVIPAPALAR